MYGCLSASLQPPAGRAQNCCSAVVVFSDRKAPADPGSENAVAAPRIAKSSCGALAIYRTITNRREQKGMRDRLSQHLPIVFLEGEHDPHRLTVHGLGFLQNLNRQRDS
jgi:hypothetical protein